MSYDISFNREEPLPEEEFIGYLNGRRNYTTTVRSTEVVGRVIETLYENRDTGVYFLLTLWDPARAVDFEELCLASINLNFWRPCFFAMETGIEVGTFAKNFGLTVKDNQAGTRPFSAEAFVKNWMAGNRVTSSFFMRKASSAEKIYTRPSMELMSIWRPRD
jgi:hypothetical protein